jgi:hypothetical protein
MNLRSRIVAFFCGLVGCVLLAMIFQVDVGSSGMAQLPAGQRSALMRSQTASRKPVRRPMVPKRPSNSSGSAGAIKPEQAKEIDQFETAVQGMQQSEGLFTLYRDRRNNKLLAEIRTDQISTYFFCAATLESGIGERGLVSGWPLATFAFYFYPVNNTLHWVVPNLYFRARADDPLRGALRRSFSESVLAALPIQAYHPIRKVYLVDLGQLLTKDFSQLTPMLSMAVGGAYELDAAKTRLGQVKSFPKNVELEALYSFDGKENPGELPVSIVAVPDSRNINVGVRYSLSELPRNNGYRPRKADERVGYFVTAFQDLSDESPREPYVRNITRWHLEKQDSSATLSPPKQPIVFWIENTVPVKYRAAVREGILMWNRAFEKAGFQEAIQVQQMPEQANWDPADVRYNTVRWVTAYDTGFLGVGPMRENPLTGEILDSDILIDADFVRYLKQQYRSLADPGLVRRQMALAQRMGDGNSCGDEDDVSEMGSRRAVQSRDEQRAKPQKAMRSRLMVGDEDLCFGVEARRQFALGGLALSMGQGGPSGKTAQDAYVNDFLRELIAHEIGHALGLRHNFRGSTMLLPKDLNNQEMTRRVGLSGSVMDYNAVNLAPMGTTQGDYFSTVVGPYDEWAIAYGYTPNPGKTLRDEAEMLEEIARRAPEPSLAYGTDEDASSGLDPQINLFDLSSDVLTYAPQQFELAQWLWRQVDQRYPLAGGSFSDVRMIFEDILRYYARYARFLPEYVGGQSFNRYKRGDAVGRLPFEPIAAEQQRRALTLLSTYVFDANAFRFSPSFLNKLAPSRWLHWGINTSTRLDYPLYDRILRLQTRILEDLLDSARLERLRDVELSTSSSDQFGLPDLFSALQTAIAGELLPSDHAGNLSSLRRGLQRDYVGRLMAMVLREVDAPEDARSLAWASLRQLRAGIEQRLKRARGMDVQSRVHLEELSDRIQKTLNAQMSTF